jgi:hypothetical protein
VALQLGDRDGSGGVNTSKCLSLRENADSTKRESAPPTMNSNIRATCAFLLLMLMVGCADLPAQTLDITHVDLFRVRGWTSTRVSVEGLRLGMSLEQAQAVLSARGLSLYDYLNRPNRCGASSHACDVSRNGLTDGTIISVELDANGHIVMILLGIPDDPATLPETIAGRFKGMTRRFFFDYSDELRVRLLGPPDRVKKSPTTDAMQGQIYYYDRIGLIVSTSRALMRGMKEPTRPELRGIQFVPPK